MNKRLILPGGILWIAGLVLSIVGMNIHTDTGSLVSVIGNILFLVGLGIVPQCMAQAEINKHANC